MRLRRMQTGLSAVPRLARSIGTFVPTPVGAATIPRAYNISRQAEFHFNYHHIIA